MAMFLSYVTNYQRVNPIKKDSTTIFPWISYGFPMDSKRKLKAEGKTSTFWHCLRGLRARRLRSGFLAIRGSVARVMKDVISEGLTPAWWIIPRIVSR